MNKRSREVNCEQIKVWKWKCLACGVVNFQDEKPFCKSPYLIHIDQHVFCGNCHAGFFPHTD